MPYFPSIPEQPVYQQVIDQFGGYNHRLRIGENEFYDMTNLTADEAPLLATRRHRGTVEPITSPGGILAKEALAVVDNGKLYYNKTDTGLSVSEGNKQLVSMGAYICVFPDGLYYNTEDDDDKGSMGAVTSNEHGSPPQYYDVQYHPCKRDGTVITPTQGAKPTTPTDGQYWVDSTQTPHALMQYSASSSMWINVPDVYSKVTVVGAQSVFTQFRQYDGVEISGVAYSGETTSVQEQYAQLNGSKVIQAIGDNWIVIVGMIDIGSTQSGTKVSVSRDVPDMDYVCEAQNRIWGCKYGVVGGKAVNEIYCCKLGDFKNWQCYQGISTDSWAASVGSDGVWTGAINYMGSPVFFKEESIHRVYISSSGAHQVTETRARGVQSGCNNSLCIVSEVAYYLSRAGVMAYDGSFPAAVGEPLGEVAYSSASAGGIDGKYYISMEAADGWHMFVYDTAKRLWHREDNTHALFFARRKADLFFVEQSGTSYNLRSVYGSTPYGDEVTPEGAFRWSATTGLIGYTTVEQKYVSRFNLRMILPKGSKADVYIQYDSIGDWMHCGHMDGVGTRSFNLPVRPRRCDHFRIRIEGTGDMRIYSFAKMFEQGSDVV